MNTLIYMDHINALSLPEVLLGRRAEALTLVGTVSRISTMSESFLQYSEMFKYTSLGSRRLVSSMVKTEFCQGTQNKVSNSAPALNWMIEETDTLIVASLNPVHGPAPLPHVLHMSHATKPVLLQQRRS